MAKFVRRTSIKDFGKSDRQTGRNRWTKLVQNPLAAMADYGTVTPQLMPRSYRDGWMPR